MTLIRPEDVGTLRELFSKEMDQPVLLRVFTQAKSRVQVPAMEQLQQECRFCEENRSLAEEVAVLSDRISLEVLDFQADAARARNAKVDKIPATLVLGDKDYGVRYFGVPSGYEFPVFVEDVIRISRRDSGLSAETRKQLHLITKDVHIQVFVTPTCPYCPQAARLAHQMAMESDHIQADSIESIEFPHLVNRYGVRGVPKIVINGNKSFEGAISESVFLQAILEAGN